MGKLGKKSVILGGLVLTTLMNLLLAPTAKADENKQISKSAADLLPLPVKEEYIIADTEQKITEYQERSNGSQLDVPLFGNDTESDFTFGFGIIVGQPSVLNGTREPAVLRRSRTSEVFPVIVYFRQKLADNQRLLLQTGGDPQVLIFDLSYTIAPESVPGSFSVNVFNVNSGYPGFENGEMEVNLPNGDNPNVGRFGGGFEYFQNLTPTLNAAWGINYQKISVRDGIFSSNLEPVDEFGNSLTVSDRGQDDLFTLNFGTLYSTLDDLKYPSVGSLFKFGIDQSIPIGRGNILFFRVAANFSQFIPLGLLSSSGNDTLMLNLQTGTILGDVPPYEGFNLGGSNSVRGYETGGVGSSRSFVLSTVEYRFPLFNAKVRSAPLNFRGLVFFDYGNDLGTGDGVIGEPSIVRGKPGKGYGYGIGIHAQTPFGLFRLETGWNDSGDNGIYFLVGDRF